MLKKKYKPSRLNKWYTKHFILAPCMRGLEVPEVTVVWWCFFASIFNSSLISLNMNNAGQAFIVLFKRDGNTYVRDQSFFADIHTLCMWNNGEHYYKQIDGVVYEITFDTPPDE